MIDDYLNFQKDTKCQFTIKELVGYSDNGMYDKIKNKYPNIYYLDKGDYNIYYMPDNSAFGHVGSFLKNKKESEKKKESETIQSK